MDQEQNVIIRYLFRKGLSARQIFNDMKNVLKTEAPSLEYVRNKYEGLKKIASPSVHNRHDSEQMHIIQIKCEKEIILDSFSTINQHFIDSNNDVKTDCEFVL